MFAPYQTPDFNAHLSHTEPARHGALAVEAYLDKCEGRWKGKAEGYDFREQEPACGKRSPARSSPNFVGDLPSLGILTSRNWHRQYFDCPSGRWRI